MDEKKLNDMLDRWAEREQASAPNLRPTRDMYALLKTRRRASWYPVMARWATVGVAAAVIAIVAVLHPAMIPGPFFRGKDATQNIVDDGYDLAETRNEAKDLNATSPQEPEQDVTQSFATVPLEAPTGRLGTEEISSSVVDKEKQELAKKTDEGTEPAPMPADLPETAVILPAPASEVFAARQREPLTGEPPIALDEKYGIEPSFGQPASRSDKGFEAHGESAVPGQKHLAAPVAVPKPEISGTVTDVETTHSKTAARREPAPIGAVRADRDSSVNIPNDPDERVPLQRSLAEEQKTTPLADLLLGDQMADMVNCTPLPDGSTSSSVDSAAGGPSVSAPVTLAETAEETEAETSESELSVIFPTQAAPQICAIQTAEKTIGAKTFRLQGQVWIDTEYDEAHAAAQERLVIQRDSEAYADLLELVPDLRVYAESGEHILVSLKTLAIEIAPEGGTALTDEDVQLLKAVEMKIQ